MHYHKHSFCLFSQTEGGIFYRNRLHPTDVLNRDLFFSPSTSPAVSKIWASYKCITAQWCRHVRVKGTHWCVWWLAWCLRSTSSPNTNPLMRWLCSDKPVSRHVEHVQIRSLRELWRDARQAVLSQTQNIQTAAATDLRQIRKQHEQTPLWPALNAPEINTIPCHKRAQY